MWMVNLTLEQMTEALARGLGEQDSRAFLKLQPESAGKKIAADPDCLVSAIQEVRA
ncbi:hypothetical protein [Cupriavidus sp. CuC1]|uniref:hypothetical protein n=1 Tax=Cupriavidus sp. CuC1 TaxID=3373131 RepID=UPI0037D181EC